MPHSQQIKFLQFFTVHTFSEKIRFTATKKISSKIPLTAIQKSWISLDPHYYTMYPSGESTERPGYRDCSSLEC